MHSDWIRLVCVFLFCLWGHKWRHCSYRRSGQRKDLTASYCIAYILSHFSDLLVQAKKKLTKFKVLVSLIFNFYISFGVKYINAVYVVFNIVPQGTTGASLCSVWFHISRTYIVPFRHRNNVHLLFRCEAERKLKRTKEDFSPSSPWGNVLVVWHNIFPKETAYSRVTWTTTKM